MHPGHGEGQINAETTNIVGVLLTNGLIIWLALLIVKRGDDTDEKVDSQEARITVLELKD